MRYWKDTAAMLPRGESARTLTAAYSWYTDQRPVDTQRNVLFGESSEKFYDVAPFHQQKGRPAGRPYPACSGNARYQGCRRFQYVKLS